LEVGVDQVILGDVDRYAYWGWRNHLANVWEKSAKGQPSSGGVWGGG